MARFRILDRNIFDTVALIDYFEGELRGSDDRGEIEFGLILKLSNFKGRV